MFNLLPESLKQQIKSEYNYRKVSLILIFIIAIQVSFLIFLFPSWIISRIREESLSAEIKKVNEVNLSSDANKIKDKIKIINNEVNLLNTTLGDQKISYFIDYVLSKKTPQIRLHSFVYSSGKTITLTISGLSETRDSLVTFVENLRSDDKFKSVDLPVSNLAKNKNIDFSVNILIPT